MAEIKNVFAAFEETAMSFEEAQAKVKAETRVKTSYFRIDKDGDYCFRVLPIAPTMVDGAWTLDRKGYEYPLTSYLVGFPTDTKGKFNYVSIIDPRQVFGNVSDDPLSVYYRLAVAALGDDKQAIESLGNITSKGGAAIRPSFLHCAYVIDMDNEKDGIQMVQLNNAQYKDLETTKMLTWKDLLKDDKNAPCPVSSLKHGYNVSATKKTGEKPSVKFTLGRRESPVDEAIVNQLLEKERIPDVIYRYERYHYEATVAYLKVLDERYGFDFMDEKDGEFKNQELNDVLQQVRMSLPADDHSHFTNSATSDDDDDTDTPKTLEDLEEMVNNLPDDADKDDPEYKELVELLKGYIENNDLDVSVRRFDTPDSILEKILKAEGKGSTQDEEEENQAGEKNPDTEEPATRPARPRRQ